jgi:hypothetical protein
MKCAAWIVVCAVAAEPAFGQVMSHYCYPGQNGVTPCPCNNPPTQPASGCNNSANTGGSFLDASGSPQVSNDTILLFTTRETPTALSVVLQGTLPIIAGVVYGQGVRCVGGTLKRLYVKTASGGSISAPTGNDLSVSQRSAQLGDPYVNLPTTRYYLVYYRDPNVLNGCPPTATFNCTIPGGISWSP